MPNSKMIEMCQQGYGCDIILSDNFEWLTLIESFTQRIHSETRIHLLTVPLPMLNGSASALFGASLKRKSKM